jgi:hypothetical protein
MVLVRGAETPSEFVDPLHDYLVQAFGLNLDRVAPQAEAETGNQIESSDKLEAMAAAQTERETAFHVAEAALKRMTAQRKRAGIGSMVALAVGLIWGVAIIVPDIIEKLAPQMEQD